MTEACVYQSTGFFYFDRLLPIAYPKNKTLQNRSKISSAASYRTQIISEFTPLENTSALRPWKYFRSTIPAATGLKPASPLEHQTECL